MVALIYLNVTVTLVLSMVISCASCMILLPFLATNKSVLPVKLETATVFPTDGDAGNVITDAVGVYVITY